MTTAYEAYTEYRRHGWQGIPLPAKSKVPRHQGWQRVGMTQQMIADYLQGDWGNLGLLTGKPSNWLVDADCDVREAAEAARFLLPTTAMRHGHRSNPGSHYWYVAPSAKTAKFEFVEDEADPKSKTMLIELRSTGLQTVVPPSIHPDGDAYTWESQGEPATVDANDLRRAVARVAAVALIARHWPGEGSRDTAAMALAGMLIHGGWSVEEADEVVTLAVRLAGDEEWHSTRRGKAAQAARKHEDGQTVTGAPTLAKTLRNGQRVVDKVREWLELRRTTADTLEDSLKQSAEQPKTPNSGEDARSENRASSGIFDETGQLWRGIIELSDVTPEQVQWLWQGRIPLGKLTIIDGNPDLGKSIVFGADLPARITTGAAMPDSTPGLSEPAGVVLLSAEDDIADTIRPRLDAAGADVSHVAAVYNVPRLKEDGSVDEASFFIPRDLLWLRQVIEYKHAKYVLIDPLMAYLHPGEVNSYRDQDVRTALAPLSRLAAETGAAIVAIRHLNKGSAANPLYRGGGSIGISAAARSVLLVADDPDDETKQRRVLARSKGNLAAPVPALAYHIEVTPGGVPYIVWEGETEHTAAQLLAMPADEETRSATDEAVEWLRATLTSAGGEMAAKDVKDKAKDEGISEKVLRSARLRVCTKPTKEGFANGWLWKLATTPAPKMPTRAKMPEDAHISKEGTFDGTGHLRNGHTLHCPKSPHGQHVYAAMRMADGRRMCVECDQPEEVLVSA